MPTRHDKNRRKHIPILIMINKNNITFGLILILVAFFCGAAAFLFMNAKTAADAQKLAVLQVQLTNLIAQKSAPFLSLADQDLVKKEPIEPEDILRRTQKVYGAKEAARKDGILWIDREKAACMITLGVANGLKPGSHLSIYQDVKGADSKVISQKIADAVVDRAYDIISYVRINQKSLSGFANDYYRVTADEGAGTGAE